MDEFNPEEELKPDTSDRRPARQQRRSKGFSAPSVSLSRQHTMIGIGIVVLVLLIIGIGSALQSPGQNTSSAPSQPAGSGRNIDLSSSMSASQEPGTPPPAAPQPSSPAPVAAQNPNAGTGSPQTLSGQPVSGTPTQAPLPSQNNNQQRIELPGNITDALSQPQQQDRVNAFSSGLPTEPATVLAPATKGGRAQLVEKSPSHVQAEKQPSPASHKTVAEAKESAKPAANAHRAPTTAVTPAPASKPAASAGSQSGTAIQSAPAGHFTLQLSSASREESLKAYAREQRLANYWVYETKRDGRPWYVLVNGVYASPEDAKRAVASLPADVQAKKPWVRPIRQVKQDLTK
ncbi:SPOR domain-containing protein [Dickeya solani]|uniref:Cell division protein DamX n=1 Tax=Dickeya solani D s0432-1 TaxID=1231725 RepID=A0AAV3K912_9GAMM|nr:SPOR domain-containing protein [Dickeya solani]ANE75124.1 hypothetical protein A4U42_07125 [Dickeya solani IPO 2222]AUC42489.1 DamX, an inner membrane protein involved in bile resistance [Dickeya solani RNS 08.23.3.1.A]AUH09462.1 hypothetical protein BJD21_13910 [Dickeya solani D s0432-1]AUH13434.1 hypothetical protein BJJ98_13880 [Dickeya solani]AYQ49658.1 hypothetical protein CTB91_03919 [Dickeya solani]